MVDDERTYEFIDHMFATLSECFVSKQIHIGMDEAHMVGRGKHLDVYGYEKKTDIMTRHLNRIREIAKKYDYEILMWSDMYFRAWNNGVARIARTTMPQDIIDTFPQDVIPVYWDYYQDCEEKYSGMQVFYSKNFSDISSALAQSIQSQTVELIQPNNNRQIKECGTSVYLIYNAKAPACLIECGFLSNKAEAQKLLTEDYQKQIAYCIALAVYDYYKIKE
jgi:hypothetical protein